MALAIDASTPAIAVQSTGTTATVTTASFTPPSGSLLLIRYSANTIDPNNPGDPTITDSLGAHLTYQAWDIGHAPDNTGTQADGQVATWTARVASSAAMTITVTNGAASPNRHAAVAVTVLTGADVTNDTSGVGAHGNTQTKSSTSSIAQNYTASRTGGWGFLVVADWFDAGAETAGTGCSLEGSADVAANYTYAFIRRTSADDTSGGTNTLRATLPGASTNLRWAWIEILPPAVTDPPSPPPQIPPALLFELALRAQARYTAGGPQTFQQSLTGTITSSGALVKTDSKPLAGTGTSSGALAKQDQKALAGAVTPAGALSTVKVVLRSFAGTITSAGALTKQAAKALAGTLTSSGALAKQDQKPVAGAVTPAGALAKQDRKSLAGTLTPAGALATTRVLLRSFTAAITSSGALAKQAGKSLTAAVTPHGALARLAGKALAGAAAAAGQLARLATKPFAGSTTPAGADATGIIGATQRATSDPAVTDRRASTAAATARRTATPTVTDRRTAAAGITARRTSTAPVTDRRASTPGVEG